MNKEELIKGKRFLEQMFIEMDNNSHKGSILDWRDFNSIITELEYHKSKMMLAVRSNDKKALKEYIADCGNILFALGNLGGLYDEPTIDDGKCSETCEVIFKQAEHKNINKSVKRINQL